MEVEFEKAFGDFLDRHEYDQAENALFAMVRISFLAGWNAAGGNPPQAEKVVTLLRGDSRTQADGSILTRKPAVPGSHP